MSLFPDDNGENDLFMSRTDPENPLGTHAPYSFELEGKIWPTVEHYFQGMKFTDDNRQEKVRSADTPGTLRVVGEGENSAPVWCGVDGCQQDWPSPEVAPGGTISLPVLGDWVDPEGDPVLLLSATDDSGLGQVATTPQGDVVFRERRSLIWKKMQIVRGCDAKRNVLVYLVYTDKLIDGSPQNSTSPAPPVACRPTSKSSTTATPACASLRPAAT